MVLAFCLLYYHEACLGFASKGLLIWYRNMIPTLFPFMVLSGIFIRTGLSANVSLLLSKTIGRLLPFPKASFYCIFMGFFCGFPMGAKVVSEQLQMGQISKEEGQFLLNFCNNIGPIYLLGYVIPLFHFKELRLLFLGMYGIPFLYGLFLWRSTRKRNRSRLLSKKAPAPAMNFMEALEQALFSAIDSITLLGGCMIFFNVLQIFPWMLSHGSLASILPNSFHPTLACLLEIGGGLELLSIERNLFPLVLGFLTFGGASCIFQTRMILKNTGLSLKNYLFHKTLQSLIGFLAGILFYAL